MEARNQHLTHLDPDKHWIGGGLAQLMRLRVIVPFISVGTVSQGALWIWKTAPDWVVASGTTAVVILSVVLLGLRSVYLRSLRTHASLRKFCKEIADAVADHDGRSDGPAAQSIYGAIVRNTAQVFQSIRTDSTLGAALRVAKKINGIKGFHTVAREGNYDERRQHGSVPIPDGKGLPNLLAESGFGVYIVNELRGDPAWHATSNDRLVDLKYALVTNITMPYPKDGKLQPATLGVLSVTSARSRFLAGFETATLEICAGIAAHALASTLREHMRAEGREPSRPRENESEQPGESMPARADRTGE